MIYYWQTKRIAMIMPYQGQLLQKAIECGWFKEESPQGICQPSLARILATALQISLAMEYLHHQDIIHGDLSTSNVLLASSIESPYGFTTKVIL